MDNNLLALFQLCDSNFPSGGFSHSFGLETYIQTGKVHNAETLSQWLDVFLKEQLVTADGLALKMAYEALQAEDQDEVWRMDRLLTIQNMPRETREGTQQMGKSMTKIVAAIYDTPLITLYKKRVKQKESFGHPAIVFAIAGHHLDIPKQKVILYYLYTVIVNLAQNAVRAIPLGQTAGQKIIHAFLPKLQTAAEEIETLDALDFGTIAPGIEWSQMQHERINVRIFMS
jgi:urease accessory protein